MNQMFDAEKLLAALPFRPINTAENLLAEYEPPIWRYPLLQSYNGFTGAQRVKTWQLSTWLRRRGRLYVAPRCDLCGGTTRLARHSENYADIEQAITLCGGCHLAVHRRFHQPKTWQRKLSGLCNAPNFAHALSVTPIDLAYHLSSIGAPCDPFEGLQRRFPDDPSIKAAIRAIQGL